MPQSGRNCCTIPVSYKQYIWLGTQESHGTKQRVLPLYWNSGNTIKQGETTALRFASYVGRLSDFLQHSCSRVILRQPLPNAVHINKDGT
jgi:hypothetical protein